MVTSEIRCAPSVGADIAFEVLGDGPPDLLMMYDGHISIDDRTTSRRWRASIAGSLRSAG